MKLFPLFLFSLIPVLSAFTQNLKTFDVPSPDGATIVHVELSDRIQWSVQQDGQAILMPSPVSLRLENEILGQQPVLTSSKTEKLSRTFNAINYVKATVKDENTQLTINFRGDYGIIFRVYNDAVAYRFFIKRKGTIIIKNEEANFNFNVDHKVFAPIQWDYRDGKIFNSSFEALYHEINLSEFPKDSLAFLPLLTDIGGNKKLLITEADLEDYPGMYLDLNSTGKGFKGVYAPYPLKAELFKINYVPSVRADYIAKTSAGRNFPWRVIVISRQDKELLGSDIIQQLASEPRISNYSWIKPGQAAWDWWNNWNISGVDFEAGINTKTYQYYIDFAAENKIPYIIMDEGWSDDWNLMKRKNDSILNLRTIIDYGKQKNVGVILWATWYSVTQNMDSVFAFYSGMGAKGFKIDFFDRDDQVAVASTYEIAKKAAEYHLMVDYHGIFKPTGLQRTYPNVISYEGVKGLENFKWANEDQPRYTTSIPFIRMLAGPMDYTPGAMRNANQVDFRPINGNPMSKGTRCQQLAEYIIFYAPLQMLSDNPTTYRREQECTDFITKIPTTFDETVPLDGKVSEYVALARRKGNEWFVGAMSNWSAREITLDFSFLPAGTYNAEIFKDGANADRKGTDYKKETIKISSGDKLKIQMSTGGGWAARVVKL